MDTVYKVLFPQMSHFGTFVEDAQRPPKIRIYIRAEGLDPLRRLEPFSTVLQILASALFSPAQCALARVRPPCLSSRRFVPGAHRDDRLGVGSHRKCPIADPQRIHSTDPGFVRFPAPGHP